ncbi:MAG: cysteine desulfurase NifS [Candidatus Brocadiia bacterium]
MSDKIYLDHAATTPVRPKVVDAMVPYYTEVFGNASSVHKFGQDARKALEDARRHVASAIGASPEEIYFTSGGTESDNLALQGIMRASGESDPHLITSSIEHHAVLSCAEHLEKEGYRLTVLPVDSDGIVELDALKDALDEDTVLVSVMLANNEVGTIQPLKQISELARDSNVFVHTDAVQAVGKIPVAVDELGVDLLSISGHKIYGPKGVGALYVRKGTRFSPLFFGGHHERNKRSGTENVASAVGLGEAIRLVEEEREEQSTRLAGLRDRLEKKLLDTIEDSYLNGHPERRLPNILNISFEFVEGESMLLTLDSQGIAVSTGSACTSGSLDPSHVLTAMGLDPAVAHGSLRFSLGRDNTEEEIDRVIEALPPIVRRLRDMSPLYKKSDQE